MDIYELRLLLTGACTHHCTFCHNEWQVRDDTELDPVLAQEAASVAIDMGANHIQLSGGEPMLHSKFPSLVRNLRRMSDTISIGMATNGTMLSASNLDLIREVGVSLRVNIPSLTPREFKRHTGGGELRRITHALDDLSSRGVRFGVNTVWLGQSREELADLVRFCALRGADLKLLLWSIGVGRSPRKPAQDLKDWLSLVGRMHKDSMSISEYQVCEGTGKVRVRLFDSPCSTRDNAACGALGEVRLLSDGTLQGCIFKKGIVVRRGDVDLLAESMTLATNARSSCPPLEKL